MAPSKGYFQPTYESTGKIIGGSMSETLASTHAIALVGSKSTDNVHIAAATGLLVVLLELCTRFRVKLRIVIVSILGNHNDTLKRVCRSISVRLQSCIIKLYYCLTVPRVPLPLPSPLQAHQHVLRLCCPSEHNR